LQIAGYGGDDTTNTRRAEGEPDKLNGLGPKEVHMGP
jgi:hypothetical protein